MSAQGFVVALGDVEISWKGRRCAFRGARLGLGCCAPGGAGSGGAVLSQCPPKVCLADRLEVET